MIFDSGDTGASGYDVGDIGHSLRFRASASAYLSRTFGAPTSDKIWTFSCWVKRGALGAFMEIFTGNSASLITALEFQTNDTLYFQLGNGANAYGFAGAMVFRDPLAAYHFQAVIDTTSATATLTGTSTDRMRLYVNGTQVTPATGIFVPPLNFVSDFNKAATPANIGRFLSGAARYFDGYLSRIAFVDGQALTPSSFGYLNTDTNAWVTKSQSQVKAVVDAGGTNSFMLDFDDGTSLTTLGYDKSSKGNNWTLNNFSLTAGVTYDWMLDTPSNNFATLNPLRNQWASGSATLSNGNLTLADAATSSGHTQTTMAFTVGAADSINVVAQITCTTSGGSYGTVGVVSAASASANYVGGQLDGYGYQTDGQKLNNSTPSAYGSNYTSGDVIRIEVNGATGALVFFKNNVSQGTAFTLPAGTYVFAVGDAQNTTQYSWSANFGQQPWVNSPTAGFKSLCTANLADPAIPNTSVAIAHRFEAGSGIASAIATDRAGWTDWLELFKRTDTTESWKVRFSDDTGNMLAFDTNAAKAAWSAPSAGTYLGAALRVGATYGLVTGTYSGDNTSNRNISHALGKPPTCGIVKNESTGTWYVWHTKMTGATYFTTLNSATPPAQANTNSPFGTGNWSSTQFMVTNNATNNLNASSNTYRYILFADISGLLALLGHTGNGSTDGAFEFANHRPQLQIEKDLAATTGFYVWSDKIDPQNVTGSYLLLNTNAAISTATGVDFVASGVKHRSATLANAANAHMDISYGRASFKYANAR